MAKTKVLQDIQASVQALREADAQPRSTVHEFEMELTPFSSGLYPVVEGVVAKGDGFMVKVKTYSYLKRLNEVYGADYRNYWE